MVDLRDVQRGEFKVRGESKGAGGRSVALP